MNARKLVHAVTELKGAKLEDGELEEILRDLKHLPELEDVADNISEHLLVDVGEETIHERYSTYKLLIKCLHMLFGARYKRTGGFKLYILIMLLIIITDYFPVCSSLLSPAIPNCVVYKLHIV